MAVGDKTILVCSPGSVVTPRREIINDPATHRAVSYIPVTRLPNGKAQIQFPEKWRPFIGMHIIYEFIDEDGKPYHGRTDRAEERINEQRGYMNGSKSKASQRKLARAWKENKKIYVGIKYVCSSLQTAIQNETSFIVAQNTWKGGHNGNRGEGDPTIDFGSPLSNGKGGRLAAKLTRLPSAAYKKMAKIKNPLEFTPKKNALLRYDAENDLFSLDFPDGWIHQLENTVYRWKVDTSTVPPDRYIGKAKFFDSRSDVHLASFNKSETTLPLPRAAKESVKNGAIVSLGALGCTSQEALHDWEAELIQAHATDPDRGHLLNIRIETSSGAPKSPLYDPYGEQDSDSDDLLSKSHDFEDADEGFLSS